MLYQVVTHSTFWRLSLCAHIWTLSAQSSNYACFNSERSLSDNIEPHASTNSQIKSATVQSIRNIHILVSPCARITLREESFVLKFPFIRSQTAGHVNKYCEADVNVYELKTFYYGIIWHTTEYLKINFYFRYCQKD